MTTLSNIGHMINKIFKNVNYSACTFLACTYRALSYQSSLVKMRF